MFGAVAPGAAVAAERAPDAEPLAEDAGVEEPRAVEDVAWPPGAAIPAGARPRAEPHVYSDPAPLTHDGAYQPASVLSDEDETTLMQWEDESGFHLRESHQLTHVLSDEDETTLMQWEDELGFHLRASYQLAHLLSDEDETTLMQWEDESSFHLRASSRSVSSVARPRWRRRTLRRPCC